MTTRMELLSTIEDIELDILVALKRPTIMQRLKFFLSQKTVSSWVAEVAKIKAARKAKIKQLRTRKENINKALKVWLDAGDRIGRYEEVRETNEWQR